MLGAYIGKLMELAEKDGNVLHLLADSGSGYDELFKRQFPRQIYNFGIAEGNAVAAAAGMATVGKIPFVFVAGSFLAYRAMEFIRNDVCFQDLNVKLVGMGSGLSTSSLGPTHHTTEDIGVLGVIPNLMILSPATPRQAAQCVELAYRHRGPVYIRLGMNREKEFFGEDYRLEAGKNDVLSVGDDAVVYVTGSILEEAARAVEMLGEDGIGVKLVNVVTLKPFSKEAVMADAATYHHFFAIEEHNIHGGLAAMIAETAAYNGLGIQVHPIGIEDVFASGYGTHRQVRQANGLDAESIYLKIKRGLSHE